jgi:hypothetical protein
MQGSNRCCGLHSGNIGLMFFGDEYSVKPRLFNPLNFNELVRLAATNFSSILCEESNDFISIQ